MPVVFGKIGHALGHGITENLLTDKFEFPHETVPSKIDDVKKLVPLYENLRLMKKLERYEDVL